jgi:hypothetical protein
MTTPAACRAAAVLVLALAGLVSLGAQTAAPVTGHLFTGREAEIEAFLRTARVVKYEDLGLGVTRPARAWLEPGGPCGSLAWKAIRPGFYKGFWESYKSEIAAYQLDRRLELHMVPPAVERRLNGRDGAAIMWLDGMRMWRDIPKEKPVTREWNAQVVRMMLFDALIGNDDRNAGNVLVDDEWRMYLIDHSRAFHTSPRVRVELAQVDAPLWSRIKALDEPRLVSALGAWIERRAIRVMLERREKIQEQIDAMVARRGAESVFIH